MRGQIQNISPDEVYAFMHSRPGGLTASEVSLRHKEVGANTLAAPRGLWWLRSLAKQFTNFFTILLIIAAIICFTADYIQPGERMDFLGWTLFSVSTLNALFSFAQEYRAERAMEELKKFLPQMVLTIRNGSEIEIPAEELVPGDVLFVREGSKIPADARLVECQDLIVSNAPLTGEANPIPLETAASERILTESTNLLLAGCMVIRGSGRAVVFATGFRTQFGHIAMLSHGIRRVASPLQRDTAHMVRVLTIIAVAMGLFFFTYGVFTGRSLWVSLVFMMGIIVANVPEGLLPTFTLSLAMGSLRMAKRNVLVKSLNAVEAMGAIHVVCTDKTGTLTLNQLTVTRVIDALDGKEAGTASARAPYLELAIEASDLSWARSSLSGDPLDVAVAKMLSGSGGDVEAILERTMQRFSFDIEKRRTAGVSQRKDGVVFAVKGAWESLRPLIGYVEDPARGKILEARSKQLEQADIIVRDMAARGQRVIALAYRYLSPPLSEESSQEDLEQELVLKGFLGLEDPLRPEVPDAVARCHEAGIDMIMITGDHPQTAEAIARRAGIVQEGTTVEGLTVTGAELAVMRENILIERLEQGVSIFARTTPEQKMKIVTALHQMHRVVAVTGDGVNDAPALKAADVGIAMGLGGTDVAREASQVILLDDNFASIVSGIEEGRTIFANIRKFTNYVLVSNGPEILPYLIYMLFPVPLALTIIQILFIDLGTDIIPSMGLGQDKPDHGIMKLPPRDRELGLLSFPLIAHSYLFLGLIEAAFSLSLFFWVLTTGEWQWGQDMAANDPLYRSATGITLSSILLMQVGNLFGRRSQYGTGIDMEAFRNPLIVLGIAFEIIFSWAILYFPPVTNVLGTAPVDYYVYAVAWCGVPLIFGLDFLRKQIAFAIR